MAHTRHLPAEFRGAKYYCVEPEWHLAPHGEQRSSRLQGDLYASGVRALSVKPDVLYADEPTSALDVSVQAKVLNQLADLRRTLGLTIVLVTHDLAVVARVCASMVVMRDGQILEAGATKDVLGNPQHEYTERLIEAADAVSLQVEENSYV